MLLVRHLVTWIGRSAAWKARTKDGRAIAVVGIFYLRHNGGNKRSSAFDFTGHFSTLTPSYNEYLVDFLPEEFLDRASHHWGGRQKLSF